MSFLRVPTKYVFLIIVLASLGLFALYSTQHSRTPELITATVERGTVSEMVSISGFVEAKQSADLAFPATGIVTDILVTEGSEVEEGELLATLASTQLVAERSEAVAALEAAQASYSKTVAGPREETITLANTTLQNAKENLARITSEEEQKVTNARTALLSTGLTAEAVDPNEGSVPPIVSGTYRCEDQDVYTINVYGSSAKSGYSFSYAGAEEGVAIASFDQPAPFGNCGLYLLLTAGSTYHNSEWLIEIPNTRSQSYTTLRSAYILAMTQADNAMAAAKDAVKAAENQNSLTTAPARNEDVTEASAAVTQAKARIAAIDARIADRSIVAPFAGSVTDVSITKGETAQTAPVITLLSDGSFSLKARVPEIDITKIAKGQTILAVFDARSGELQTGTVVYISPIALQIDGVAYFEVTIELNESPSWLRAGLNADIDIITEQKEEVLRIPKRFVTTDAQGQSVVLLRSGNKVATTTVEILFIGNDSFLEIEGLPEGSVVVAP